MSLKDAFRGLAGLKLWLTGAVFIAIIDSFGLHWKLLKLISRNERAAVLIFMFYYVLTVQNGLMQAIFLSFNFLIKLSFANIYDLLQFVYMFDSL